jgi:hypothetical protein
MRCGGCLSLRVTGSIRDDEPVMGAKCYDVEIESIKWPKGGFVDDKLIENMDEVEDDFLKEAKQASEEYDG